MLGYAHLLMSMMSLLTPMALHFMHSHTVTGLQFIAGLMAVSRFSCRITNCELLS